MSTYLTTEELSARIKYDVRTIRQCLKDAVLFEGVVVVKLNWPRFCIQASIFALTRSVSAHRYIDVV